LKPDDKNPGASFYTKLHANEFECQSLKVFETAALIFQKFAGSGPSP
jgi:hypothetical protein